MIHYFERLLPIWIWYFHQGSTTYFCSLSTFHILLWEGNFSVVSYSSHLCLYTWVTLIHTPNILTSMSPAWFLMDFGERFLPIYLKERIILEEIYFNVKIAAICLTNGLSIYPLYLFQTRPIDNLPSNRRAEFESRDGSRDRRRCVFLFTKQSIWGWRRGSGGFEPRHPWRWWRRDVGWCFRCIVPSLPSRIPTPSRTHRCRLFISWLRRLLPPRMLRYLYVCLLLIKCHFQLLIFNRLPNNSPST